MNLKTVLSVALLLASTSVFAQAKSQIIECLTMDQGYPKTLSIDMFSPNPQQAVLNISDKGKTVEIELSGGGYTPEKGVAQPVVSMTYKGTFSTVTAYETLYVDQLPHRSQDINLKVNDAEVAFLCSAK